MLLSTLTALCATAISAVSATTLFVADYSGNITSLSLTANDGSYNLTKTHVNDGCGPNPSWLTIDSHRGLLFCMNEGFSTPNGSLTSFTISRDGSLQKVANIATPNGPVSGVIYGDPTGPQAIALAHYGGSAVSSYLIDAAGTLTVNQNLFYTLPQPGPDPTRQDAPHVHEVVTDPTGQYILAPDLGADLVRIYTWDRRTLALTALPPLVAAPGSGPRHLAFYTPSGIPGSSPTYLYLVGELAATVTGYAVRYTADGLAFDLLGAQATTGLQPLARRNAPAEIHVSPDNRFLVISNRNDSSFALPADAGGRSDSFSTWRLCEKSGNLTFHQLWPAGGSYPRHFETNAIGNLVAVGFQMSQAVAVLERDVATGLIGEPVARLAIEGNVTAVVFDERRALGGLGS
jgi:6-phosphogluconolactonase (cycloisomerase 2 family)